MMLNRFNRPHLALLAGGLAVALAALSGPTQAPAQGRPQAAAMIAGWPESSRKAYADITRKYGPPQEVTATEMVWMNKGPWKRTILSKKETDHFFPAPHKDVLQQVINYRLNPNMFTELGNYDGSVIVERTKGELSARCDMEGANFLAINLANDILTRKRSVADARAYYAKAMMMFKSTGRMDPYMQRLQFTPATGNTGDPDKPAM